jgi:hypothetical protein
LPAKCRQILPFRAVLAVVVDLPEALHIGFILCAMQGRLQFIEGFRQSLAMVLPDPALPENRDPALTAVSQHYYYPGVPAGEMIADLLSYFVPGLEKAVKDRGAKKREPHKCLHPVRFS